MKPIIIANWKANKTLEEIKTWVEKTKPILSKQNNAEIIICPSFTSIGLLNSSFKGTNVKTAGQTVSHFEQGAYTGEVTASMLQGVVEYCIAGHSERKRFFNETEEDVLRKIETLLAAKIKPIFCIAGLKQLDNYLAKNIKLYGNKDIIFVYEPPEAISVAGKYRAQSPEEADVEAGKFAEKVGSDVVIYGGSVNPDNIAAFLSTKHIKGALIGNASLNPDTFLKLVENIKK